MVSGCPAGTWLRVGHGWIYAPFKAHCTLLGVGTGDGGGARVGVGEGAGGVGGGGVGDGGGVGLESGADEGVGFGAGTEVVTAATDGLAVGFAVGVDGPAEGTLDGDAPDGGWGDAIGEGDTTDETDDAC